MTDRLGVGDHLVQDAAEMCLVGSESAVSPAEAIRRDTKTTGDQGISAIVAHVVTDPCVRGESWCPGSVYRSEHCPTVLA